MSPDPLPSGADLERLLEVNEITQYEDFFEALPADVGERLAMRLERKGRMLRLTASGYDHPMFNRVMGVGLDREGSEEGPEATLVRAAAHYEAAGVRRWMVQLLPHVEPDRFAETAARHGVIRLRGWTKHLGPAERQIPSRSELRVVRLDPEAPAGVESEPSLIDAWVEIAVQNSGFPASFASWLRAAPATWSGSGSPSPTFVRTGDPRNPRLESCVSTRSSWCRSSWALGTWSG